MLSLFNLFHDFIRHCLFLMQSNLDSEHARQCAGYDVGLNRYSYVFYFILDYQTTCCEYWSSLKKPMNIKNICVVV